MLQRGQIVDPSIMLEKAASYVFCVKYHLADRDSCEKVKGGGTFPEIQKMVPSHHGQKPIVLY
jgi:hypothetical protein